MDRRVDPEHQLVDKAVLDQERREGPTSRADQIAIVFVLEPLNSFGHVALDEGGVPLERGSERRGGYPLGHRVQHVGPAPVSSGRRPICGESLVVLPPNQHAGGVLPHLELRRFVVTFQDQQASGAGTGSSINPSTVITVVMMTLPMKSSRC